MRQRASMRITAAVTDVAALFLPALIRHWERGRFPVERLITEYDFDAIEQAAADAQSGRTIQPVLRMSS